MELNQEWINLCIQRDERSLNRLYKTLYPFLTKICYRYAKNKEEAMSYLNLAFLRIIEKLPLYDLAYPFEVWARKLTINTILNELAKNKSWSSRGDCITDYEQLIEDDSQTYASGYASLTSNDLIAMIQKLPEPGKTILNLHVFEGYAHKEIAEMLGISEESSRWHLHKVKNILKVQLQTIDINV